MEQKKNKSIIDRVWDLFASVKFAVVIFSFIALSSIVGTILEQNVKPEKNLRILAKFFGDSAQSVYSVLDAMGFMNMYHSWWFVAFLLLFAANLIICSLDRLPRIWKLVKEPVHALDPERVEKMTIRRSVTLKGKPASREQIVTAMAAIGFKPSASSQEADLRFCSEKGNFTRLGVYVTHLSILVILAGAIIGVRFGFNAFLPLQEGTISTVAYQNNGVQVPLGFGIRCDDFEVQYYGETDMPKAYRSWLTILQDGREVMHKSIVVNDPLTYHGITFYQSSFGTVPGGVGKGEIRLIAIAKDGKSAPVQTGFGGTFTIPGTTVTGKILDFSPALAFDNNTGQPYTYQEELVNPALLIQFTSPDEKPDTRWILKRFPQTWDLPDGNKVQFVDYWGAQYTGLQVRKDPGVWIVYLGCIVMALGLYTTFFMSHRRLWIDVVEEKGGSKVLIGASANRNRAAFEQKIDKMAGLLGAGNKEVK